MNFQVMNTALCLPYVGQVNHGTLQAKQSIPSIIARHLGAETGCAPIAPVTE